jgi:hypothetical protein
MLRRYPKEVLCCPEKYDFVQIPYESMDGMLGMHGMYSMHCMDSMYNTDDIHGHHLFLHHKY